MNLRNVSAVTLLAWAWGCGPPRGTEGIAVPDGFEIELVAGPPLVERPMIIDMDDLGRLYVAESSGSNDDVRQQLAERPHSILLLASGSKFGRQGGA